MVLSAEHIQAALTNRIGILSCHPAVTRFLCDFLRRSRKLHRLISDAQPLNFDDYGQRPCLIVVDTVLADVSSIRTMARRTHAKFPASKLVGLASSGDERVIELLQLGFSAVVQITEQFECDITSAITEVLSGSIWVPEPAIRRYSMRVESTLEVRFTRDRLLTAREAQILESVLWGRSNKDIACNLAIGERTVKFHLSNIFSKMGVKRRSELIRVFSQPDECDENSFSRPPTKWGSELN